METEKLVGTLEEAGLSPYEAEAYVGLLELGAASATEVAEAGEIPAPRVYDVLRSLENRGYVETYEQDTLRARAHSPADVLADLRERAERMETAADEVEDRWEQPALESEHPSVVKRLRTVIERAERFIERANTQVLVSVTPDHYRELQPALAAAHDRGVSVRASVYARDPEELPPVEAFEDVCVEVRGRTVPAPQVILVDRRKTCFAHHPEAHDQYGMLVNDRVHTFVFRWYFLTCLWDPWEPVFSALDDELPVEYVDVRYLVRDIEPLLSEGIRVKLRVEGYDVDSGGSRELEGYVVDLVSPEGTDEAGAVNLAGQVSVVLETDDGRITVGGFGAMVEQVEATRIVLQTLESEDGTPTYEASEVPFDL